MDELKAQALLDGLWKLQADSGLSDSELAREIGVHYSLISHIKAGRRGMGLKVALAVVARFPELRSSLLPELPIVNDIVTVSKEREALAS